MTTTSLKIIYSTDPSVESTEWEVDTEREYRINSTRTELKSIQGSSCAVMEYVADEARSTNPVIHVYAEVALRAYIYYKLCERKAVPANEKSRARSEYYNERRKANRRLRTSQGGGNENH